MDTESEKLAQELASPTAQTEVSKMDPPVRELELTAKQNRGRFQPGDMRINRSGRPRGSKTSPLSAPCCARRADRIKRVIFDPRDIGHRLTNQHSAWIVSMPRDFEIVDSFVDAVGMHMIVRSESFPKIARGTPIPVLEPFFNGLMYRRFRIVSAAEAQPNGLVG